MADQPTPLNQPDSQNQDQYSSSMEAEVSTTSTVVPAPESIATLGVKRRASSTFEGMQDDCRKRMKEDERAVLEGTGVDSSSSSSSATAVGLVEDLSEELQCGCCSGLIYKPVMVSPCQHFFCGSCIVLWIRNGGTNCPACRSESAIVSPSRPLQIIIDTLLRAAPRKARSERERQQADDIYRGGISMRIPTPREASPEPNINISAEYARPCPHCLPNNPYRWTCPQPIPDPNTDIDHAWHLEDGTPPGHGHCGNCEVLMALQAPTSTKCELCQTMFCGIAVPHRCIAAPLLAQHLHGMEDIGDLIQCQDVYECFNGNTVEVDFMLDHLTAQGLTPRHIYREIINHIKAQPRQFAPLIEQDLFVDGALELEPHPEASREKICRRCATEVFLWGLKEWWIRERQKGFVEGRFAHRKDCPEGADCTRQKDLGESCFLLFMVFNF
ncbi:hypothetical protein E1B28_012306 [Marasmius oreades]|uniref:RING-type domain-containing protein n=1 Tax=Marasmius oreades TaxID=181124 RepID=A0A9P7RS81_9AGAR|nr:uncharacterized protein E1B28_012306 [Marasmius oreades]KAG7088296.1 hypothetical protein E1B28_012306 [Marasmius oreades]